MAERWAHPTIPSTRELDLNSQAELHWNPPGPHAKPMKIEAGQVIYRENLAGIWLIPWARLTRDNTVVEAGDTVIALQDGKIHHVDAQKAHGTDSYPSRKLQYGADHLRSITTIRARWRRSPAREMRAWFPIRRGRKLPQRATSVDLQFADYNGESAMTMAVVSGHGFLESKPLATPGHDPAETRILRSEIIQMKMRPGGREIARLETHAPSELEFLPNMASQRHRKFIGERMWINYGAQNRIQSFSAVNCRTLSDPTADELAKKAPVTTTASKNVSAAFDPKTSQLTRMEQWGDFSYESGDRKARADRGILEQVENRITLDQHARMWDSTGNTTADRIVLDEKSGNFTAEGHVNTSRMPDQSKKKSDSAMLSGDEPLQAVAHSMSSANHNKLVKYDGDAVLWQGVNRIQADHVEIDRDKRSITADGHVVTQSREEEKKTDDSASAPAATAAKPADAAQTAASPKPADAAPAIFTLVKAPHMVYTDEDRLAHYSGGVLLNRAGLQMKAADLRSWLAEEGADNRLQKAVADGAVEIVQSGPIRTRTGTSEHAEYYTDDEKIVLRGGQPNDERQPPREHSRHGVDLLFQRRPFARELARTAIQPSAISARSILNEPTGNQGNLKIVSRPQGGGRRDRQRRPGGSGWSAGGQWRGEDHVILYDRGADQPGFRMHPGGRCGYHAAADVSARAARHQLSAAGSQRVPQADGRGEPDGDPGDAAIAQPRTARDAGPADRAAGPGEGAAQPGLHAVGRRAAARGDRALAGDRAQVSAAGRAVLRHRSDPGAGAAAHHLRSEAGAASASW